MPIKPLTNNFKEAKRNTVKIECREEQYSSEGSGTILTCSGRYYILTAAHCVYIKEKGKSFQKENITIRIIANNDCYNVKVINIKAALKDDIDCAVLEVEKPEIEIKDNVRLFKGETLVKCSLLGYFHGLNSVSVQYAHFTRENTWMINGVDLVNQSTNPVLRHEGISGGGVWCESEDLIYMIAYIKGFANKLADYNEIICYSPNLFCVLEPTLGCLLVEDIEAESVELDSTKNNYNNFFLPIGDSLLNDNFKFSFLTAPKLIEIIGLLRNDDEMTIMLRALSGLGKSRLLKEAFSTKFVNPNSYYHKYYGNDGMLMQQLNTLLYKLRDNDGLIIIDDCPLLLYQDVVRLRDQKNKGIRIICTNHDYFDDFIRPNDSKVICLAPNDLKEAVDTHIDECIGTDNNTLSDRYDIKRMAGGFPQMALELLEAYKQGKPRNVDLVSGLMPRILKFDPKEEDNQKKMMYLLSLCQPLPYDGNQREAFEYLIKSHYFSFFPKALDFDERINLSERLIRKFKPTLIDVQSGWLYVRPFPLAVWLTKQWFSYADKYQFQKLIVEMQEQPEWIQNTISRGFCKHIEQMHGNKEAFELVGKLFEKGENSPFLNEKVLCSGVGSKFFLAMTSVNPEAVAIGLSELLLSKSFDWLRNNLMDDARRNIIWALEKLCFAHESYANAIMVMAALAVAENENHISNNAYGQIRQLFHIHLPGTEATLEQRLETLHALANKREKYRKLTLDCINSAFHNSGFSRMGGPEKFGQERKEDYIPSTYREIFDYWNGCRDLLLNILKENPSSVDDIAAIVQERTSMWIYDRCFKLIEPLLDAIGNLKNNNWEQEYECLYQVKQTRGDNMSTEEKEWCTKMIQRFRPSRFVIGLTEMRHDIFADYRRKDTDVHTLIKERYRPLAKLFIDKGIYANQAELTSIIKEKEFIGIQFIELIIDQISNEQLSVFAETITKIVLLENGDVNSRFLYDLCRVGFGTFPIQKLLTDLKQNNKHTLYVRLLTGCEQEDLSCYNRIKREGSANELNINWLNEFLLHFQALSNAQFIKLVVQVANDFPDKNNELVAFFIRYRLSINIEEFTEIRHIVKQVVLKYKFETDNNGRMNSEYADILQSLLKKEYDEEFAKNICIKLIDVYNSNYININAENIFPLLIEKYFDAIWPIISEAMLMEDKYWFCYQVKGEIGSGMGFGAGKLFTCGHDEEIKNFCKKNPEKAPAIIAELIPCYRYENTNNEQCEVTGFSDWFCWLLDEFGEDKLVRSSLHGNLGSFSWTGSIIPYYDRNIMCFKQLLKHSKPEVIEWAECVIKAYKKERNAEAEREDYMRIHYDLGV